MNKIFYEQNRDRFDSVWVKIHPIITRISKKLFDDGHYAEAVFSAFKEVNFRVKNIVINKTGRELDGKDLKKNIYKYE